MYQMPRQKHWELWVLSSLRTQCSGIANSKETTRDHVYDWYSDGIFFSKKKSDDTCIVCIHFIRSCMIFSLQIHCFNFPQSWLLPSSMWLHCQFQLCRAVGCWPAGPGCCALTTLNWLNMLSSNECCNFLDKHFALTSIWILWDYKVSCSPTCVAEQFIL